LQCIEEYSPEAIAGTQVAGQSIEIAWQLFLTRRNSRRNGEVLVPMDATEREVVVDLIESVRSLASQVLTLHLQLGAVRTILARKGTMSEAELSATLTRLEAVTSVDEFMSNDKVDEMFDHLLRRIQHA
jgi:hypothetical protein